MRKSVSIAITVICIVIIALLVGGQILLKPQIEHNIAEIMRENCRSNGLVLEEDSFKVSINPLTRTVNIQPFTATLPEVQDVKKVKFGASQINLTWYALLADTPLASWILPKSGLVPLYNNAQCSAVEIELAQGSLKFSEPKFKHLAIDAPAVQAFMAGTLAKQHFAAQLKQLSFGQVILNLQKERVNFEIGSIVLEDISPQQIGLFIVNKFRFLRHDELIASCKQMQQKDIRIMAPEESAMLTNRLIRQGSQGILKILGEEFFTQTPLVQSTIWTGLKFKIDSDVYEIVEASIEAGGQDMPQISLGFKDLNLPKKIFEAVNNWQLPLPDKVLISLDTSLRASQTAHKKVKILLDVADIGTVELDFSAVLRSLEDIQRMGMLVPLRDAQMTFKDKSLLARIAMVAAPHGSAEAFFGQQLKVLGQMALQEQTLIDNLENFVHKPGTISVTTPKGRSFTLQDIDKMQPAEVLQFFTLEFVPGAEQLDQQVQRLRQSANTSR